MSVYITATLAFILCLIGLADLYARSENKLTVTQCAMLQLILEKKLKDQGVDQ